MRRARIKNHRADVLDELATTIKFYLRGIRDTTFKGLPNGQRDSAALNLAVAISNLEEAAQRFRGRYRIRSRHRSVAA